MSRRRIIAVAAVAAVGIAAFVLVWFEPQALFFDDRVDEAVPVAASDDAAPPATSAPGGATTTTDAPPTPVELGAGTLRGIEGHSVRGGRAVLLELADGSRFLRLEDLDVENGPDLKVYLSAASADGDADAHDDDYVGLGGLKGNLGSSNYEVPAGVDLDRYATAVIWCERFSVGFAVAGLSSAAPG